VNSSGRYSRCEKTTPTKKEGDPSREKNPPKEKRETKHSHDHAALGIPAKLTKSYTGKATLLECGG